MPRLIVVPPWVQFLLAAAALCLFALPARGSIEWSFAVADVQGDGWRAEGITISLVEQPVDTLAVMIQLGQLELPDGRGAVKGLRLECPEVVRSEQVWQCANGRLVLEDSPIHAQEGTWQGTYRSDGQWHLAIPKLAVAGGSVALEFTLRDGTWSAQLRSNRTAVARLATLSGAIDLPRAWGIEGWASGLVTLSGEATDVARLDADLVVDQLNYASPDATQAAEKVVLKAEVRARAKNAAWYFDADLGWPRGALYAAPLFVDATKSPLHAKANGHWQASRNLLALDSWSVDLTDTLAVSGTGSIEIPGMAVRELTVAARSDDVGRLYQVLLQPFLIGTAADDLQAKGRLGLALHFDGEGIRQAGLDLSGLALEDRQGRFALQQTDGSVAWDRTKAVPESRLTVQGASVYRIPAAAFSITARFAGDRVYLAEPVVVPVLGGQVRLDTFELSGALVAGEKPHWEASASVRAVSLEQLTTLLDWPPFNGTVQGQLRDMRYAASVFSVGGGLELDAFDGNILVSNLQIQDPLGAVPLLQADAKFRGLNLEALTRTFSFGRIEGRLDGDIGDIQLVAWQPERFGLHFYSPQEDDLRHRISQRAVENLTELGSGVPAGVSATFLRVFDEFRYDKIDLKITLRGNVAELDGLAREGGGYYLVRGSGLPRIDVIGRNRSVAWKDLIERLRRIQVEGAQIQ